MNKQDFIDKILKPRLASIEQTFLIKNQEYAGDDVFENFEEAGFLQGCIREKAWLGMVTKHIVALVKFIKELNVGHLRSEEQWKEKINDTMVYLVLLEGLVAELPYTMPKQCDCMVSGNGCVGEVMPGNHLGDDFKPKSEFHKIKEYK